MAEQQHKTTRKSVESDEQVETTEVDAERKGRLDDDVDALLDENDDILEENAEEFVRSFVQKGGQ